MESDQLSRMWRDAQQQYTKITGRDIEGLPRNVNEETLVDCLNRQIQQRQVFNNEGSELRSDLKNTISFVAPVVGVVMTLASGVPMAGPVQVVLGALQVAINAANGVSKSLEQINVMLDKLQALSDRLVHLGQIELSPEHRHILVKHLVILMRIFAISTKQMEDGSTWTRTKMFAKYVGPKQDEVSALLEELERGIVNELSQSTTETLVTVKHNTVALDATAQRMMEEFSGLKAQMAAMALNPKARRDSLSIQKLFKTKGSEDNDVLKLLSPSEAADKELYRLDEAFVKGEDGQKLGIWILSEPSYLEWKSGHGRHLARLIVNGFSGSGKTFLANNVIHDLKARDSAAVGYFFFSRDADRTVSASKALCTMASQIAVQYSAYSRHVREHCKRAADMEHFDTAWKLLFSDFFRPTQKPVKRQVFLVIDAIGALPVADRANMLNKLQQVGSRDVGLKVLLFGRPDFCKDLEKDIPTIQVGQSKNGDDVTRYVKAKLQEVSKLKRLPLNSQDRIAYAVSAKADGLFVWADLALAEVDRKDVSSESSISDVLNHVPSGLEDALSHSLEQVAASLSPEKLSELNCLLAWVSQFKDPNVTMTLDLLNVLHRLDGTHDGDMVSLRDSLLRYPTIFKLDVSDDSWMDGTELHSNGMPGIQRVTSEQTLLEDRLCRANPKSVSVSFCHTSVRDYIRGQQRRPVQTTKAAASRNPISSTFWAQQKISCYLMQVLQGSTSTVRVDVKRYARRYWMEHLLDGIQARLEVDGIHKLLYPLLTRVEALGVWLQDLDSMHLSYTSAKAIETVLKHPDAHDYFEQQPKEVRKWLKTIGEKPLLVYEYVMWTCGRTWLKASPPHYLSLKLASAAVQYHATFDYPPTAPAYRSWSLHTTVNSFTTKAVTEAAKHYSGKHKAVWNCRVAAAYALAKGDGEQQARRALVKIKDKEVRWEADLALARICVKHSQWDEAIEYAKRALHDLATFPRDQNHQQFAYDANKFVAECFKSRLKAMSGTNPAYNQMAMEVAEHMRRAIRLQPATSNHLLNEVICTLHGVALRLMVEGTFIDPEDFFEDDLYDSEDQEDGESNSATKASGSQPSISSPKTTSEGHESKDRPGSEKRTMSETSVNSSKRGSEPGNKLWRASRASTYMRGSASAFRTSSHGSEQALSGANAPWQDDPDQIDELDDGVLSSPRLYLDQNDGNVSSDVCHSKVMSLLVDLDGSSIEGRKWEGELDFGYNIEQYRLHKRLATIVELYPRLVDIMAFSALRSGQMSWFIDLFRRAEVYEGQMKHQKETTLLKTHLGTILSVYAGRHDDAIRLWESVAKERLLPSQVAGEPGQLQAKASKQLSRLCVSRAESDPSKADEYVNITQSLDALPTSFVSSRVGPQQAQTKLHLATWHHNHGDPAKARSLAQDDVLWALNILTDDDPGNDFDGFYVLANALRAVQDDQNHLAARHAMRQYDVDNSAITTANKKKKASTTTDAFCSGLCLQEYKQWDDMMLCRSCPDLNLCPNCWTLFSSDELYLNICDPSHQFLKVPRMKHSFTRGNQVVVDDRVVELDEWVAKLRQQWQVSDTSDKPTSRWRRQSSTPLGPDDKGKTGRKRDTFRRLLSH